MSTPLRVLILEDCPTDAELMALELKKSDFAPAWQRVETEQAYLAALDQPLDLILADHALPQYDSAHALDALKQRGLDVPFIIVSGSIDEELAVGLMKKGAADYVSKDRLARLGIVVANALQQWQLREEKRQAEQKLRDSEAWFRALLDRSHDAVVVIDRAGRIQYASPGVVRVLGQTPQEYIGSDVFARVHPDDLPRARQLFEDLLRQPGQTVTALFRGQHKDGSCRWVEASATSLLDQPPVDAIVVNYRDVTERKAAEDQLRLQSKAMEAATLGIVITDRQGTIVYVNPAFTAMTGYSREEALGQNPRILKSGKHPPQLYREMWETILVGQVWQGELTNQRKDGSLYTEVTSITPVRDEHGEITHFIAIKQDITERKKLEAQFLQAQKMVSSRWKASRAWEVPSASTCRAAWPLPAERESWPPGRCQAARKPFSWSRTTLACAVWLP